MFIFTKQEQTVLVSFALTVLLGSLGDAALKRYPALKDIVNLIESDAIYAKTDINSASFDELVGIPYIGEYTAMNIIKYRRSQGPFTSIEQIKNVKGIRDKNYERFYRHIKVKKTKKPEFDPGSQIFFDPGGRSRLIK